MTTQEIVWLAGLIEGEGSFFTGRARSGKSPRPVMAITMCDADVMARVSALVGVKMIRRPPGPRGTRPSYQIVVTGGRAVGWAMTLYTWLGERRRAKVREIVAAWKSIRNGSHLKLGCKRGHEFTPENTRVAQQGKYTVRFCRACNRERKVA